MEDSHKIRIMHVAQSGSGVERYLRLLIGKMDPERFEHILVCSSENYKREDYEALTAGFEPIRLTREIGLQDVSAIVSVRRAIRKYRPDILYAHSSKAGGIARLANLGTGIPCIYNPHGWAFHMLVPRRKTMFYTVLERSLSHFCRRIVCVSEAERRSALERHICGERKLTVIVSGIELRAANRSGREVSGNEAPPREALGDEAPTREALANETPTREALGNEAPTREAPANEVPTREALGIPAHAFVVGMTANYHPQKAPDIFLQAAVRIREEVPEAVFLVVGGGWTEDKVEQLVGTALRGAFFLTGWVKNPLDYVRLFDVALLLSRYEAFGLVLAEYMQMKKPIVATRVDAIPFLISDRENGLLVEPDDAEGAYRAVMELYRDRVLGKRLAEYGFRRVWRDFNADRMAKEHECLMEEILGRTEAEKSRRAQKRSNLAEVYKSKSLFYKGVKRLGDIVLSSAALVCLSPLLLITAAAITLEDGGSPFFTQERMGKDMKPFRFYKFRSMYVGADRKLAELLKDNEQSGHAFKIKNDPRITRVGRFIRKYSIDELPQLINIIKGDMSIVGPRPILTWQMEEADAHDRQRMLVRPGLTCYWQIQGRSDIPWEEWVELDLDYIEDMGFWTDTRLIAKTIPAIFGGEGSY